MDKARLGAGLDYVYPTLQHLDGSAIFLGVSSASAKDGFGFGAIAAVNRLGCSRRSPWGLPPVPATERAGRVQARRLGHQDGPLAVRRSRQTVQHKWVHPPDTFESIEDVQQIAAGWLWSYNNKRPTIGTDEDEPRLTT